MKKIHNSSFKRSIFIGLLTLSAVFVSCENELDINNDPNNPTEVPLATLLSGSEVNLTYTLGGDGTRMPASIVQHYAGHRGQPLNYGQYNITSADTDGLWASLYDILIDLRAIENQTKISGDRIYLGISQVLQVYTFSVATDLFGDIPFSQSLQGASNITPAYDKQEAIYPALLASLDEAIVNLKSEAGAKPAAADLIYSGNIVKWEAFANSLKLRLLNHLSKKNPTQALTFLQTNPTLITDVSNNAKVTYGTVASNANPIHQFDILSGRKDNAVCKTIVDNMKSLNDPRISKFFFPVANNGSGFAGEYLGNLPGQDLDDSGENLFSRVGPAYASINSPVILISAAEVEFIKSEIYFRANDLVNSKIAYDNAIAKDFEALGVTDATYIINPLVAYNNTLERIMGQKWITMYQASYESFVDWRRTGFPVLTAPATNRTSGVTPRRLPYPQKEINVNGASLQAGPGIPVPYVTLTTKVWWDL
ncbi:SusD/RagB family nutrient-binding outer membrane lipoprotein [Flavobacterium geliluteum]|uniref:SusD/RagB family nutrient-binding outer membrane lipoprotein n=1 Tax=Flavobacterium geliluteum TaxID=2816120 RepID=A0A940X9G4_9FLAO|nr:SusD/RagB family nutrient-binding outer membrane lipoprotein [Flavobacterium geliluteum]MBP4137721.1 SusD/RagB family nutrient-binding outer membrane lipoprotein [Flavobacterium geliluteum]